MGRLRVLYVVDRLNRGGRQRLTVDLANAVGRLDVDVAVCETRGAGPLGTELESSIEHLVLHRRGRFDPWPVIQLTRFVRRRGIDVVHAHGRGSMRLVALLRLLAGRPIVVFHEHSGTSSSAPAAAATARLLRSADAVVAPSRDVADWMTQQVGVPTSRVHLVPNGVAVDRFAAVEPSFPAPGEPVVLACVARLDDPKDHVMLLEAVARARCSSRLRLVVAGDEVSGPYAREVRARAGTLGIVDQMSFLGDCDDVPGLLAGAHVGVLASRREAGPIALLEYAASGLPFVVTDAGELAAALRGSGGGFVVPSGDADAFADALDAVIDAGPDHMAAMGRRGHAAAGELGVEHAAGALLDLYGVVGRDTRRRRRRAASIRGRIR